MPNVLRIWMLSIFELEYCVDFIADVKMSVNINWNKMEFKVSITCGRTCASLLTFSHPN